jgi:hypothetical protein
MKETKYTYKQLEEIAPSCYWKTLPIKTGVYIFMHWKTIWKYEK